VILVAVVTKRQIVHLKLKENGTEWMVSPLQRNPSFNQVGQSGLSVHNGRIK
jgi:hypothetical protein